MATRPLTFSYFPSKYRQRVLSVIDVEELTRKIRYSETIKENTLEAREALARGDLGAYDVAKNSLPVITPAWAGPKGARTKKSDQWHNGALGFDVDKAADGSDMDPDEAPEILERIIRWGGARYASLSASGCLWIIVQAESPVPARLYTPAWWAVLSGMPPDIRCHVGLESPNLTRLRFLAHHTDPYDNPGQPPVKLDLDELEKAAGPVRTAAMVRQPRPKPPVTDQGLVLPGAKARPYPASTSGLEWMGIAATMERLLSTLTGATWEGSSIRAECPAHSGSVGSGHLYLTAKDDRRIVAHCFSTRCTGGYSDLAAAIEKAAGCRLSEQPPL